MVPLDCDGEANPRPISADVAASFVPLAEGYFADDGRNDCDTVTPNSEPAKGRIQGAARRRIGCPRDQMPCSTKHLLAGWDGEDRRIRGEADDCDGEPGGPKVTASGHVAIIVQANARAARGDDGDCDGDEHLCTLCSVTIPPTAQRDVWTWTPERERHPITLHAHRGCNAIRREIDIGEWTQGDLVDRLVEWHEDDRLNHDLGELDAGLTPEERDDMGGEIIAAALRAIVDDSDTDVDGDGCDIIRVTMDGDDANSWTVDCCEEHDPLARVWNTAADARAELGPDLDWWEEEPNVWMAHLSLASA